MADNQTTQDSGDSSIREQVVAVIEEIRPMLQRDGGDLEFVDMTDDGVVSVRFHGACVGCPARNMTLSQGVEAHLKQRIPSVQHVQAVS